MSGIVKPIFLLSLPRSGSTLAQRMLATHEEIATTAEPTILLPYLYMLRDRGMYAEYGHYHALEAIEDFYRSLPGGKEEYLSELRRLVLRLYASAAPGDARYFLDKTPRYSLVVEDVMNLFPEGKFIFLWRNPLAVVASAMASFPPKGEWNLYRAERLLFGGLGNLIEAYRRNSTEVHAVRYEDLVARPAEELAGIFSYLELPFDRAVLERFNETELRGRFKDPIGTKQYDMVSQEPLEKWKQTLGNPIRKAWSRRYLRWIGAERLAVMGYALNELLAELDSVPASSRWLASDVRNIGFGLAYRLYRAWIFRDKRQKIKARFKDLSS